MPNLHRGEIEAHLDGRAHSLCLTLGALAELENAFGASGIADLARRFEGGNLSALDLVKIIGAGLRGAGGALSDEEVARLSHPEGLPGFVRIAAALIVATFGDATPLPDTPANPPVPQDA